MEGITYQPGQEVPGTVYRVIKHLATGGMGSVYEVEDTTVEKKYVMKTLHPQLLAREDLAKRMKEEAKMLAKLHHPNIVDVVTAGITQDAQRVPYYVMERLNGVNLRHMLDKKGALDAVHALRIAIDVLDALEHAHENGVVHRDVKPENIFLHRNASGTTTTKLLDFGIMRLIDRKSTDVGRGKFVGTIRYASPEQIMGEQVGPASDLYAVGLLLYEMIAGRGPFDDVTEGYAIGMAHVTRPVPPLSSLARAVTPEIEHIVHAALAKKAAERPADAFSFASELRRFMPGGPLSPRMPRASTPTDPLAYGITEASAPPMTPVTPIAGRAAPISVPSASVNHTSMAGEARTRPPASAASVVVPIAIAAVVGVALIGSAVLYVMRGRPTPASAGASAAVSSVVAPPSSAPASAASMPTSAPAVVQSGAASSTPPTAQVEGGGEGGAKPRPRGPVSGGPAAPKATASAKKAIRPEDVGFE